MKKAKGTLLMNNGQVKVVTGAGARFELRELQELVGGLIEILPTSISDNYVLVCNEESKCVDGWTVNILATGMYAHSVARLETGGDVIAGTALLVNTHYIN